MARPVNSEDNSLPVKQAEPNKKAIILTSVAVGAIVGASAGVVFGPVGILAGAVAGAVVGVFAALATFAINALMDRFANKQIQPVQAQAVQVQAAQAKPTDEQLATIHSEAVELYLSFLDEGKYDNEGAFRIGGQVASKEMSSRIRGEILPTEASALRTKIHKACDQNDSPSVFLTDFIKNTEFEGLLSMPFENIEQAKGLLEKATELKGNPNNSELKEQIISELQTIFLNQSQTKQNAQRKFLQALKTTADSGRTLMDTEGLAVTPGKILFSELEKAASEKSDDMLAIAAMRVLTQFIIENADHICVSPQ